jgi:hypothetical protein
MRKLLLALALFVALAGATRALAQGDKNDADYAVDADGVLYEIECDKLQHKKIGRVRAGTDAPILCDLAATADGYLYGISTTHLYLIKISKPEESICLGAHGLANPYGMGSGAGGELVVNTRDGKVFTVDKKTAKATEVGDMTGGFVASGDVALAGDRLVSSVKDANGDENLVTLDPKTGKARLVGRFKDQNGADIPNVFGLIWRKDVLYALTSGGDILRVDPFTARCVRLLSTGISWWGATDYQRI